jgi:hypothetical protein
MASSARAWFRNPPLWGRLTIVVTGLVASTVLFGPMLLLDLIAFALALQALGEMACFILFAILSSRP